MHLALIALVAFGTSAAVVPALLPLLRARALDVPNERSGHVDPTPRGGGLGVLVALLVALAASSLWGGGDLPLWFLVGAVGMAAIGLSDDLWSPSVRLRLALQAVCALVISAAVVGTDAPRDHLVLGLGVVLVVGFVNAFNFMDGINGISGTVGALTGAWYAVLGARADSTWTVSVSLALAGACAGFLVWNVSGRVFLGDVGSYLIGALAAGLGLSLWHTGDVGWVAAGAPLALYVADTTWTLTRRVRSGKRPGVAHRDHVYQQLVDGGLSSTTVCAVVSAAVVLTCVAATIAFRLPLVGSALAVTVVTAYLLLPRLVAARVSGP